MSAGHRRAMIGRLRAFVQIAEIVERLSRTRPLSWHVEATCLSIERPGGEILVTLDDELFVEVNDAAGHTIYSRVLVTAQVAGRLGTLVDGLLAMLDGLEEAA